MKVKKILTFYWMIPLSLVVLFLRLPSLFEPFTYGDEGIYLTLGLAVRKGLTLYRDIHDNKPPMLYFLAALAGNFAYYRALFFLWSLVTIYIFFKLAKKVFPEGEEAVIIATFVFGILTSIHTFEGNIANAENFMLLPTILGVILILKTNFHPPAGRQGRLLLAGVMFSLATLFKVPAAFDFLAILVFLIFSLFKNSRNQKFHFSLPISHFPFLVGFALPTLITIIYYASKGALDQYFQAAFLQNIPYLTSWGSGSHAQFNPFRSGLFIRGILLLVICYLLFVKSKKFSRNFLLIALWFTFSLFAALLSARPYPHYLIQTFPSLSLLLGFFLTLRVRKVMGLEMLFVFFAFLLFILSFCFYRFWHYPNIPYYTNFYQYAFGRKSKQEYFADFDPKANDIYEAAEFITEHTLSDERIFIWGNEPYLYALSRRLPPSRYTVAYHIIDFDGREETIRATENQEISLIMTTNIDREFHALKTLLKRKYIKIKKIGDFEFYQRIMI